MEKPLANSPRVLQQWPARPIQTSPAVNSRNRFVNCVPSLVLARNKAQGSRVHPDPIVMAPSKQLLLMPIGKWVKVRPPQDK
jgi:hypothetical protein